MSVLKRRSLSPLILGWTVRRPIPLVSSDSLEVVQRLPEYIPTYFWPFLEVVTFKLSGGKLR